MEISIEDIVPAKEKLDVLQSSRSLIPFMVDSDKRRVEFLCLTELITVK